MFKLEIKTENAAFHDDKDSESRDPATRNAEIARLLLNVAAKFTSGEIEEDDSGYLMDYNGNKVGFWQVESDD